jgi:hypothetical protein
MGKKKKIVSRQNIGATINCVLGVNISGRSNLLGVNIFWGLKFVGGQQFWRVRQCLGSTNLGCQKLLGAKLVWGPKKLVNIFVGKHYLRVTKCLG